MDKKRSQNWAQRRKKAIEKLGDHLLEFAEEEAKSIQFRIKQAIESAVENEFKNIKEDELNLKEELLKSLLKSIPIDKPMSITIDLALAKIARRAMAPMNPFGE